MPNPYTDPWYMQDWASNPANPNTQYPGYSSSDYYPYGTQNNPLENTNPPVFQPWQNAYASDLLGLLGGPEGMSGILEQARDMTPNMFLNQLPYGRGQVWDYITNQLTGRGATQRAGQYRDLAMNQTNAAFTDMFNRERSGVAATGGRGSSSAAMREAQGRRALAGARGDVELGAMTYEDQLRDAMFGRGMGVANAYQGAFRGDEAARADYRNFLTESLGPELAALGIDVGILQGLSDQEFQAFLQENGFNVDLYGASMGRPRDNNQWLPYLLQFLG